MLPPQRPNTHGHAQPMLNLSPGVQLLLLANIAVQIIRWVLPADLDAMLVDSFGFTAGQPLTAWSAVTLLTYQFLHAGFSHILVNMLMLLAFGTGVERMVGTGRMLALYLASGVAGGLAEGLTIEVGRLALLIGASGAVSGLFGGILWLLAARGGWPRLLLLAGLWIGLMVVTGVLGIIPGELGAPVAWIAHLGGFLTGLALMPLMRRSLAWF